MLKAILLVGGPSRGTRFRPLSLHHPKPLFPIAGVPMIEHHVRELCEQFQPASKNAIVLQEILLIGYYDAALFEPYLQEWMRTWPAVRMRYLREYESLGTGGGLFHFRDHILRGNPKAFLVVHSDVCARFPFAEMVSFHLDKEALVTLMGTQVPKETSHRYGCLVADQQQQVLHYAEKPETFVSDLISCGVYVMHPDVFTSIQQVVEARGSGEKDHYSLQPAEVVKLETDILRPMAGTGKLFVYRTEGFWRQIKTAGSALSANQLMLGYLKKVQPSHLSSCSAADVQTPPLSPTGPNGPMIVGNVVIHPAATVHPSAKIGPNVSIGPRVIIGPGVRVRDSILLDNVEIKEYSCVQYAIIGWKSVIGRWVRIEGTPPYASDKSISAALNITNDVPGSVYLQPATDLMLENGMKNQSATILGESVRVQDEVMVRNCIVLPHKELKNSCKNEILM